MVAVQLSQSVVLPNFDLSQWLRSTVKSRCLSIALSLSLAIVGAASATVVQATDVSTVSHTPSTVAPMTVANSQSRSLVASSLPSLPNDGIYVYGQSDQPDQLGRAYLVFEVSQDKVVGGFYMPNSSFDCFSGNVEANKLALTVVDSYDLTQRHPYSIALAADTSVASRNPGAPSFNLDGYQRINSIGSTEQHILRVCKADFSN